MSTVHVKVDTRMKCGDKALNKQVPCVMVNLLNE